MGFMEYLGWNYPQTPLPIRCSPTIVNPASHQNSGSVALAGQRSFHLVLASVKPLENDAKKLYVRKQIKYQYRRQFIGENSTGSGL